MSTQSRTVRVFLSSTFRDFAEERDLLVRKIFPELRRKCRERQVELVDVDLRWGITEEEAQQGKVLPICLAEIDRSRPFFMGFIGDRYGWVPEKNQYDLSLIMEQSWLDEHRGGKSVTELEMLHGVLNNPAMEDRAFFYFRDSAYSQAKGGAYLSEGPQEKAKLEALKDRIRQSGFPVVENYRSPEELAELVRDDLWKLIDEAFPESEVPDALARERMRHEAFTASRLGLYIGGESYFAKIDSAMPFEPRRPVLVTGDSGGGKSALLANWASRFSKNNPSAILLTHCLATGADAAQPVNMAVRILREISRITGEELVLEGDPRKALHILAPWLARAGTFAIQNGGVFVLILDGLDKMDAQHDMGWWPSMLPEGVGLVASCLSGKVFDAISSRMDWEKLPVSPLKRKDCETFIASHLGKYRKSLTPELTSKVVSHPLSGNPLFLRTLLEELRVFGVHEELGPKLDHYLSSLTVDDLFERVLERVESDNSPESVRAVMEVLWAAKESFAEDELLAVSGLPPAVWAPIHIALDESLIGEGGRLAFSHDYLRKAVQDRYLTEEKDRKRIRNKFADLCASAMESGRKDISHYVRRHAVEHFLEVEDWDHATAALSDLEFIEARAIAQELPAMLTDYAEAVKLLPEGEKERNNEAARQAELDRYAREMYEYSATWSRIRAGSGEPEPILPLPVESVRLWTEEEIATECKRITESPNRLDIVKAFRVFVATNSDPLQQYSMQEGFTANFARNDAPAGPVHQEGKKRLKEVYGIKLMRRFHREEHYNPMPACVAELQGHEGSIKCLAASVDGRRVISGSSDNTVRIWDAETYDCLKVLKGHQDSVNSVAISKNGRQIVSVSSDRTVRVWNEANGECTHILQVTQGEMQYVSFDKDDLSIILQTNEECQIWDISKRECIKIIPASGSALAPVTHNGQVIAAFISEKNLGLWDLLTGDYIKSIQHNSLITSVSLGIKYILLGHIDGLQTIWDLESGQCINTIQKEKGYRAPHELTICHLAIDNRENKSITASGDRILRVWDINSGKCLKAINTGGEIISAFAASCDGSHIFTGGNDKTIKIWNSRNGNSSNIPRMHRGSIRGLTVSADERYIGSAGSDLKLRIWKEQDLECLTNIENKCSVFRNALNIKSNYLISGGGDKVLRIWDPQTGKCLKTMKGHEAEVMSVAISSDFQTIFSGSGDKNVRVWDLLSGKCINLMQGHERSVSCVKTYNKSHYLCSGSYDRTLRIWDINTGDSIKVLKGHDGGIACLVLSKDDRKIVSGSIDKTLRIWDSSSGKCLKVLHGHDAGINSVFLSNDENLIYSAGDDSTLRIWDFNTGKCEKIYYLSGLTCMENYHSFSKLVSGFRDGRVHCYEIVKN